jgi:hypothetical protein
MRMVRRRLRAHHKFVRIGLGTFRSEICCAHFGTSKGSTIRTVGFAPEVPPENRSVCIAIPQQGQP